MMITAVLDANVLVSAIISKSGAPAKLIELLEREKYSLAMSQATLDELSEVLRREKLAVKYNLRESWVVEFLDHLRSVVVWCEPQGELSGVSVDPKDDKYVHCAVTARAQYIVSGDKHLLSIKRYEGIEILLPAAFLVVLQTDDMGA